MLNVNDLISSLSSNGLDDTKLADDLKEWFNQNEEGFNIRDLDEINLMIDLLLLKLLEYFSIFKGVLKRLLQICSKPLIELKANERLSPIGNERIKIYYAKLSNLWCIPNLYLKMELASTFRCIVNGGRDPTKLRSEYEEWVSDGTSMKVTDKKLIQKLVRESGTIDLLVAEFVNATNQLDYSVENNELVDDDIKKPTAIEEKVTDPVGFDPSGSPNSDVKPIQNNKTPAVLRDLTQVLLDLSLDVSEDPITAALMCKSRICEGALLLIEKDFHFNKSDNRISFAIELMWNVLENYIYEVKRTSAQSPLLITSRSDLSLGVDKSTPNLLDDEALLLDSNIMDFEPAVYILQDVFHQRLMEGFRLYDKETRNEVLIVLSMIAEFPKAIPYMMESGFFEMVITYACVEEAGIDSWSYFMQPLANPRSFATISDIDLEFKKELWLIITRITKSDHPDILKCLASSPMITCMLYYLEMDSLDPSKKSTTSLLSPGSNFRSTSGDNYELNQSSYDSIPIASTSIMFKDVEEDVETAVQTEASPSRSPNGKSMTSPTKSSVSSTPQRKIHKLIASFPINKLREFQSFAMTFLVHNVPKILPQFEAMKGIQRLLVLLLKYLPSNSVEEHVNLIFNGLVLINKCIALSETVLIQLESCQAIETFLKIFQNSNHDDTRALSIRLISAMCSNNNKECQKEMKLLRGIDELIHPIARYVEPRKPLVGAKGGVKLSIIGGNDLQDPLESPYGGEISVIIIALLDCISKGIVGNKVNENYFADHEGLDALLDLLEVSPFILRIQVLRLIADLSQNRRLVTFVNAWRSAKTLRSAAQILCHCWLDEEYRLKTKRNKGIISNVRNPLGTDKFVEGEALLASTTSQEGLQQLEKAIEHVMFPVVEEDLEKDLVHKSSEVSIATTTSSILTDGNRSYAISRLAAAILVGRNTMQTNLPIDVCDKVLALDSRVIIANAIRATGAFEIYGITDAVGSDEKRSPRREECNERVFEDGEPVDIVNTLPVGESSPMVDDKAKVDLSLEPSDKQVLIMAIRYDALREGEWWREVREYVKEAGITPIEADQALMDSRLSYSLAAANNVQMDQVQSYEEEEKMKKECEVEFIDQIISKKNQQIKAEWMKRNSRTRVVVNQTKQKIIK